MIQSKSIQRLEERMADLAPGTLRHEALEAAKRFKSSWIELGRILLTLWREKKFREWGYLTFEAYCVKEIGIRSATAKKLLHSYYFLEKEEPTVLKRLTQGPPANLPSPDAVNLLRLLGKKQAVPSARYQEIRDHVLEKGAEPLEVRRQVRSILEAAAPDPEAARAARRQGMIRRMIGTLKGLKIEMGASNAVPKELLGEIETLLKKLEEAL